MNIKPNALSRLHESLDEPQTKDTILPKEEFLAPITWDIHRDIEQATQGPCGMPRGWLFTWAHSSPALGHPGIWHSQIILARRFWWPTLVADKERL